MSNKNRKKVVIIGGGPAGLTFAWQLIKETPDYLPIILEQDNIVGGIARTVNYFGNRIDIGGHRFFSKNDDIMEFWQRILPPMGYPAVDDVEKGREIPLKKECIIEILRKGEFKIPCPDPNVEDKVLLIRERLSRIYYSGNFFEYPLSLKLDTLRKLGLIKVIKIGATYIKSSIFKRRERNLEDFFINRFGSELYNTFFKEYTYKVWGAYPSEISAEWGYQRVKGLSIKKAIMDALKNVFQLNRGNIEQKKTETSLIKRFLYPKYGPGHMWEEVANQVVNAGGDIRLNYKAIKLHVENNSISGVTALNTTTGETITLNADIVISTMPVKDLINSLDAKVPNDIEKIANGLMYRDFMIVGLLIKKLRVKDIEDNWIYVQDPGTTMGRIQIFNNWSPYMVKDNKYYWIGCEYFLNESDSLWKKDDTNIIKQAALELKKIGFIEDIKDVFYERSVVIRMPKAYPSYLGTYKNFDLIKEYLDENYKNLFLIGRNGMHRYNNMDHSMLAAFEAVKSIKSGSFEKKNIWSVNTEKEYHEEK